MAKVRILSASDIEKLFTLDMAVKAVENAYRQKSTGEGSVWPMVFHEFVHGEADLDIKSGDLKCENIFGLCRICSAHRCSLTGKPGSRKLC